LVAVELTDTQLSRTLQSVAPEATCPQCQVASRRVHSRYKRHLWDLPVGTRSVCLHLHLRKFRCDNPACPKPHLHHTCPASLPSAGRSHPECKRRAVSCVFSQSGWLRGRSRMPGALCDSTRIWRP